MAALSARRDVRIRGALMAMDQVRERALTDRPRTSDVPRTLKVLHLSTVGNAGGAGRAAFRLHQGLTRLGHESLVLAGHPIGLAPGVEHLSGSLTSKTSLIDAAIGRIGQPLDQLFGLGRWSWRDSWRIADLDAFKHADVVNVHNVHGGYFNVRALGHLSRFKPVVWTLHDMWALTGHCAYAYGCDRWQEGCHTCPLLRGEGRRVVEPAATVLDRTRAAWNMKRSLYRTAALHVVTPSRWLECLVHQSILQSAQTVQCIPYGIDLDRFRLMEQAAAREALGLSREARVVFFSADLLQSPRKGAEYLIDALGQLKRTDGTWLLTSGEGPDLGTTPLPVQVRSLGYQNDERRQQLALAAADICVSPTLADNLPLVLLESLASGTPVVAFDVGGISEIVRHGRTGYLARDRDVADLARGIELFLYSDALRGQAARTCRRVAEQEFALELAATRYVAVYERAIAMHRGGEAAV